MYILVVQLSKTPKEWSGRVEDRKEPRRGSMCKAKGDTKKKMATDQTPKKRELQVGDTFRDPATQQLYLVVADGARLPTGVCRQFNCRGKAGRPVQLV